MLDCSFYPVSRQENCLRLMLDLLLLPVISVRVRVRARARACACACVRVGFELFSTEEGKYNLSRAPSSVLEASWIGVVFWVLGRSGAGLWWW